MRLSVFFFFFFAFLSFPEKIAAGADRAVSPVDDSESWPRLTGLFLKSCEHAACRHLYPLFFPPSVSLDWKTWVWLGEGQQSESGWPKGGSYGILGAQSWWAGLARRWELGDFDSGGSIQKLAGAGSGGKTIYRFCQLAPSLPLSPSLLVSVAFF